MKNISIALFILSGTLLGLALLAYLVIIVPYLLSSGSLPLIMIGVVTAIYAVVYSATVFYDQFKCLKKELSNDQ